MRALFWKDCRINLLVLVLGAGLLTAPYIASVLWQWTAEAPQRGEVAWAQLLFGASYFSLAGSQLTLALLGGNAIASERADRSAEFLAYLPPSRGMILRSKLLLAVLVAGLVWGLNLLVADGLAPWMSDTRLNVLDLPSRWSLAAGGVLLFGAAWLGSTFLSSPTFAASLGIVAPALVAGALALLTIAFAWPAPEKLKDWTVAAYWTVGLLAFLSGTWYYLRRVEP